MMMFTSNAAHAQNFFINRTKADKGDRRPQEPLVIKGDKGDIGRAGRQGPSGLNRINGRQGLPGLMGLVRPRGSQGIQGIQGPPGTTENTIIRNVKTSPTKLSAIVNTKAQCNSDEKISGGGISINGGIRSILASQPQNNSWVVQATNPFDTSDGNIGSFNSSCNLYNVCLIIIFIFNSITY
jgi:hypothetical protein